MKDPENLLGVLKDLVGNNEVSPTIVNRQAITLNISYVNFVSLPDEGLCVCSSTFYGYECGLRMKSSDDF